MKRLFWLGIVIIALITVSCLTKDYGSGDDPGIGGPYQTRILKVLVQPDTVARGDTTRITCVIKDSLDKRFIFVWQLQYGKPINVRDTIWAPKADLKAYTSGHRNYIDWIAPNDTSSGFGLSVRADNHAPDSVAVEYTTSVWVR